MSEAAESSQGLPDGAYVYRTISKTRADGERVKPEAYWRRPGKDPEGVSVWLTEDGARSWGERLPYAVAHIRVGSIRALGLDVEQSPDDPDHFAITGLSYYYTAEPPPDFAAQKRALDLAEELAKVSVIVWRRDQSSTP